MKISKKIFDQLRELAKNAYPNEVGGILLGKKEINDFILFPGIFSRHYVSINTFNIPIYATASGTFHSHPTTSSFPSRADINMFSKIGNTHLILSHPYMQDDFHCFDSKGNKKDIFIQ